MRQQINDGEIRRALGILKPRGQLLEIRIICSPSRKTASGYFSDPDKAVEELHKILEELHRDRRTRDDNINIYWITGEIDPACYSRTQRDKFTIGAKTTTDNDVLRYQWELIDFDPDRPSGTSSTDEQLQAAIERAEGAREHLAVIYGFPEPLLVQSGNGAHLVYRTSFDNTDENRRILKQFLLALGLIFSGSIDGGPAVSVDTSTWNPAQPCKLPGTKAMKGSDSPDRPHRMAKLLEIPEHIEELSLDSIKAFIQDNPTDQENRSQETATSTEGATPGSSPTWLENWLAEHGIEYQEKTDEGKFFKYIVQCPFDDSHTGKDAALFAYKAGGVGFKCFHDHCSGYGWKEYRQHYEPDAYQHKGKRQEATDFEDDEPEEISLTSLSDIEEVPAEWLIDGYIPRKQITVLAGDGGTGKTFLWCNLAAAITRGKPSLLDEPDDGVSRDPGNVIFFSSEDSVQTILKPRLRHADADMRRIQTIPIESPSFMKIKFNSKTLEDLIAASRPALCIFDPLQSFIPPDIQMGSRNAMRDCLAPLIALGEKYGTTFLIIMHTNKKIGVWGRTRLADSSDIWDIARSVLISGDTGSRNGTRYLSHEKCNYGPLQRTILYSIEDDGVEWQDITDKRDKDFVVKAAQEGRPSPALDDAKDFILEKLQGGEWHEIREIDDAAELADISTATLRRARRELNRDSKIERRTTGFGKDKKHEIRITSEDDLLESDADER